MAVAKKVPVKGTSDVGRKAYTMAQSQLRLENKDRFDVLLDEAYAELGQKSPRLQRVERERARLAASAEREKKRLARLAEKQAQLRADLEKVEAALKPVTVDQPSEVSDGLSVFSED